MSFRSTLEPTRILFERFMDKRHSTVLRVLGWILAGIFALLIVAILVVELMSWNFLKEPITDRVEAMTGRELEINGDISVSLLPRPQLEIGEMAFANADWASTQEMVTVDSLEIEPSLSSLLQGELALEHVKITKPIVNLESRDQEPGNWIMSAMQSSDEGTPEDASDGSGTEDEAGLPIPIQRLSVYDAKIRYLAPEQESPQVLSLASLEVSGDTVSLNGKADLEMSGERVVVPAELSATLDRGFADNHWRLSDIQAQVGEVRVNGNIGVDTGASPLSVAGELHSPSINVTNILAALPETESAAPPTVSVPVLPVMAGDIRLTVDQLIMEPVTFNNVEARLRPGEHELALQTLDFELAEGGRGEASASLTSNPDYISAEVRLDLEQADLQALGLPGEADRLLDLELGLSLDSIQQSPSLSLGTLLEHLDFGVAQAHYRTVDQDTATSSDLKLNLKRAGEPPEPTLSVTGTFQGEPLEMTIEGAPLPELANAPAEYRLQAQVSSGGLIGWANTQLGEILNPASLAGNFAVNGNGGEELEAWLETTLPPLPEFRLSGRLSREENLWSVTSLDGNVGVTELDGEVQYRTGDRPEVNVDLQAGRIELAQFMGASTSNGESSDQENGDDEDSPLDALQGINGQLNLRAETLVVPDMPELTGLQVAASLDSGQLVIDPLSFDVAGGSLNGALALDATQPPASGTIDAEFEAIELSAFGDTYAAIEERLGMLSGELHVEITEALPTDRQEELLAPFIGRLVVEPSTLRFTDPEADTDMELKLQTRGLDTGEQAFLIDGDGRYDGAPFSMDFRGDRLLDARKPEQPYSLALEMDVVDTEIQVEGSILQPLALEGLNLEVDIKGPNPQRLTRLLGIPLPDLPPYSISGNLDYEDESWLLTDAEGEIGESDLGGSFTFDTGPTPPHLTADLRSGSLDLEDLGVLVGATSPTSEEAAEGGPAGDDERNFVLPDRPLVTSAWQDISADVSYRGEDLRAAGIPLENVAIDFELNDGVGHFSPVRFGIGGGEITFDLSLDATKEQPQGTLLVEIQSVDLQKVLQNSEMGSDTFGTVGAQGKFWVTGTSIADLFASADGGLVMLMVKGQLDAILVELAGLDASQSFLSWISGRDPLPIDCAYMDVQTRDGIAKIDTLAIDTTDTSFTGTGTVNFNNERLDVTLVAHPKDVSVLSARTPLHLGGTLGNPEPGLDRIDLAFQVASSVALGALATPVAALLPLLDLGLGDEVGYCSGLASRSLEAIDDTSEGEDEPANDER